MRTRRLPFILMAAGLFFCGPRDTPSTFVAVTGLNIAPDEKQVAFSGYERSFNKYIFTMDLATGRIVRVIQGDEFDWTFDSRSLVVADRRGIYLVDLATRKEKELFKNKFPYFANRIRCSPVKEEVLFVSSFRDDNPEVYKVNYTNLKIYRLTNNKVEDDFPQWSFDGSRITYLSNNMPFVMEHEGDNKTMLLEKLSDAQPAWAPDGKKLALTMLVAKKKHGTPVILDNKGNLQVFKKDYERTLFLINVDGSDFEEISEGFEPQWNRDGSHILFKFTGGGTTPHLYTYNLQTRKFTPLLPQAIDSTFSFSSSTFFPTSSLIMAVAQNAMDRPNGICIIKPDATGYQRILSF